VVQKPRLGVQGLLSSLLRFINDVLTLVKYSIGVGDRFAHQAKAQFRANPWS
jgi:hypothetical protein